MKGLANTVLIVEEESIHSKFQDILTIVKQSGECGLLKTIILLTRPPRRARRALSQARPQERNNRRRTRWVCKTFDDTHAWKNERILPQDAQKVRPARPQPMKTPEA